MGDSQISHAGKALVKSFIEIKGMRKERGKEIQRDTKDGGVVREGSRQSFTF